MIQGPGMFVGWGLRQWTWACQTSFVGRKYYDQEYCADFQHFIVKVLL